MSFIWRDPCSIAWPANSAPDRMYVHVSGGANVSCTAGVHRFAGTGGVIDRAANGADYDHADGYAQARVAAFGTNSILRLRLRSNGTNFVEATVNLTSGAWTLGNQGGSSGGGVIDAPPVAGDTFRLEATGGTSAALRLLHQPGSAGPFTDEGSVSGVAAAASGRAGYGITAVAGDLDDPECGPLVAALPKQGVVRTNLIAALAPGAAGTGDTQAGTPAQLWNNGWDNWLQSVLDPLHARGWRRLCVLWWGANSTGQRVGASHTGSPVEGGPAPVPLRGYDIGRTRLGYTTEVPDGRILDNLLTAWKPRVDAWEDVISYDPFPPNGLGAGAIAWPTDDASLALWCHEQRVLGMSRMYDAASAIDPSQVESSIVRRLIDYEIRTAPRGERRYGEAHVADESANLYPYVVAPHSSGGFRVGPWQGWATLDSEAAPFISFTSVQDASHPLRWFGPHRLTAQVEHVCMLPGNLPVAERYRLAVRRLIQGHTVMTDTNGFTPHEERHLIDLGRSMADDFPRRTRRPRPTPTARL